LTTSTVDAEALGAGGTLPRAPGIAQPRPLRRLWLFVEMCVLFAGTPLIIDYAVHTLRIPLFEVLQPVLLGIILLLLADRGFRVLREFSRPIPWRELFSILTLFLVVGGSITVWMHEYRPGLFLDMMHARPRLWRLIMIFYPLLSVIPQELVYRTFFFHRYGPMFGRWKWAAVLVNGALFGFAHIMFGSWTSMLLSGALGTLLAYRYAVTRSFWAVWLEHTLYGDLIFTVGLGAFFFTGVSPIR
jgi:hypothetical protein